MTNGIHSQTITQTETETLIKTTTTTTSSTPTNHSRADSLARRYTGFNGILDMVCHFPGYRPTINPYSFEGQERIDVAELRALYELVTGREAFPAHADLAKRHEGYKRSSVRLVSVKKTVAHSKS